MKYFGLKALETINYLHNIKCYFGDMKPQNLLIFRDFSVKLGDFGIAIKIPTNESLDYKESLRGFTSGYCKDYIYELFKDN